LREFAAAFYPLCFVKHHAWPRRPRLLCMRLWQMLQWPRASRSCILEGCVPANFLTPAGSVSRNATAPAPADFHPFQDIFFQCSPVCGRPRAHCRFCLITLRIKQNSIASGGSRPFPKCVSPHEISTFCTCLKKNRYFSAFFAVLPLRSFSSFVIVRCGPSFLQENRGFPTRGWSRRGRDGQKIQEDRQKKWQLSH